jgi:hypothetical protein
MPTKTNEPAKYKDTMRPEYDMTGGVRGKYANRLKGGSGGLIIDFHEAFRCK